MAIQRGNENIFSSGLESVYDAPALQASSFLNRQQYFLDKDVLFISLITNSVSSLAAISWSVDFAADSSIRNNRILAEELGKTSITYSNNVRGYEQLQRQIMYGMASVASIPITAPAGLVIGRGGVLAGRNILSSSTRFINRLRIDRALQESIVDGINTIIGDPSLAGQLGGLNRSQVIQILVKAKHADKIKKVLDQLNNIR